MKYNYAVCQLHGSGVSAGLAGLSNCTHHTGKAVLFGQCAQYREGAKWEWAGEGPSSKHDGSVVIARRLHRLHDPTVWADHASSRASGIVHLHQTSLSTHRRSHAFPTKAGPALSSL